MAEARRSPTNFGDLGRHSVPHQVATLLTFERLLADLSPRPRRPLPNGDNESLPHDGT
jgi:hypothetical protein